MHLKRNLEEFYIGTLHVCEGVSIEAGKDFSRLVDDTIPVHRQGHLQRGV